MPPDDRLAPEPASEAATRTGSIRGLVIQGAMWTAVAFVVTQGLRFGSNVVLTRLLTPEAFGLMGIVNVVLSGIGLLSDVGLGPAVLRSDRSNDPVFLNTAWTMQVVRAVGIFVVSVALAWPVSLFYREPQLVWLMPVAATGALIGGFSSMKLVLLDRDLRVRQKFWLDLIGQIAALATMIAVGLWHRSVWALVVGTLAGAVCYLILGHRLPGVPDRFRWDREVVASLATFGRWIFLSTGLMFLGNQADRLILARFLSIEFLGIYGIAAGLAELPERFFAILGHKVVLPAMSKVLHLPTAEVRGKLARASLQLLLPFSIVTALLLTFGDLLVLWIYDDRYVGAAWILPILMIGTWTKALTFSSEPFLVASGRVKYLAFANGVRLVMNLVAIPVGVLVYGVPGAVAAVVVRSAAYYLAVTVGLRRQGVAMPMRDGALLLGTVALVLVLAGVRYALGFGTSLDLMPPVR